MRSSVATVFTAGSALFTTCSIEERPADAASLRIWLSARSSEEPSNTAATASTAYSRTHWPEPGGEVKARYASKRENPPPAIKIPTAAINDQKNRSAP
jgi:hypothetical protein